MDIRVENLHIQYGKHHILKGLDTVFPQGKITTLIGPNGSGKTTLLRGISGNVKPIQGDIWIGKKNINQYKIKELSKVISYLPQFHHTPSSITVEELVAYGRHPHIDFLSKLSKQDQEAIDWALELTDLSSKRHRLVSQLSGGQRQRVWITLALAQQGIYMLLDEPINNLDIAYQIEILELLKKINQEMDLTVILVLHDINYALRYSDKIIVMKDGNIYAQGEPEEVITKTIIKEVFGVNSLIRKEGGIPYMICEKIDCV